MLGEVDCEIISGTVFNKLVDEVESCEVTEGGLSVVTDVEDVDEDGLIVTVGVDSIAGDVGVVELTFGGNP